MSKAILVDPSKCINCKACQVACKHWNETGYEDLDTIEAYADLNIPPAITPNTWMRLMVKEIDNGDRPLYRFTKTQCMHCEDAACVAACPSGATHKDDEGYTVFDAKKCIGCNYCVSACPFQACKYDEQEKKIFRCIFCPDRRAADTATACSTHCPTGCLTYGDRDELIKEAEARLADYRKVYPNACLYGVEELGGMHYIYILQDEPGTYGLPAKPSVPVGVTIWNALVKPGGGVIAAALVVGTGAAAVINARHRRMEMLQKEKSAAGGE